MTLTAATWSLVGAVLAASLGLAKAIVTLLAEVRHTQTRLSEVKDLTAQTLVAAVSLPDLAVLPRPIDTAGQPIERRHH